MNILIVAATEFEIRNFSIIKEKNLDCLITGIGNTVTVFKLTEQLNRKKYDLIIDIGIAGSFKKELAIGTVVQVLSETIGDLGFESKDSFIPISKSPIGANQQNSFQNPNQFTYLQHLKSVDSISVNSSSGNTKTINERLKHFNADIENMEGAGVFYVCTEKDIPFIEIRSISNYIEERNPQNWNIPLALENLKIEVTNIINHLSSNPNA